MINFKLIFNGLFLQPDFRPLTQRSSNYPPSQTPMNFRREKRFKSGAVIDGVVKMQTNDFKSTKRALVTIFH